MIVRMGIDFGTAFTKVAIRAGVDLVPVEWSGVTAGAAEAERYVVPDVVVRGEDGEYRWQRDDAGQIQANLKLPIIESKGLDRCPTATVAYLALVIRYARAFLYRKTEIGRKLVGRSLCWELNMGCPTKPHDDPAIVAAFHRIVRTAWQAAAWEHLHESDIEAAWQNQPVDVGLECEPVVVPEFVAQIAGYLSSSQASPGLHALIDVGAATLDVATFNVVMSNDRTAMPRIPIFFSAVVPLGTHHLRHNRYAQLGLELCWNDATPVEAADLFGERNGKSADEIMAVDQGFMTKVTNRIVGVVDTTRTNTRGEPSSPAWREGLPIFVTGGGARCALYREAIEQAQRRLIQVIGQRPGGPRQFRFIELNPTSGEARDLDAEGRLTVAYGLTEDAESIARVVPHRDVESLTRLNKPRPDQADLYGDR